MRHHFTWAGQTKTSSDAPPKGMYVKADFVHDANRDVYACPAGEDLTHRNKTEERSIPIRRNWLNGCKGCPLRSNCTTGNERRISRWEREDLVDDMDSRLGRDPDFMTLHRCIVEQPCPAPPGTPDTAQRQHL